MVNKNKKRKKKHIVRAHRQHWTRATKGHTFLSSFCSIYLIYFVAFIVCDCIVVAELRRKKDSMLDQKKSTLDTDFEIDPQLQRNMIDMYARTLTRVFPLSPHDEHAYKRFINGRQHLHTCVVIAHSLNHRRHKKKWNKAKAEIKTKAK